MPLVARPPPFQRLSIPSSKVQSSSASVRCCCASGPGPHRPQNRADTNADDLEAINRAAARHAIEKFAAKAKRVGFGCGVITNYAIEYLADLQHKDDFQGVVGVPSSGVQAFEMAVHGLPVAPLEEGQVDVTFCEANEVDKASLSCIVGRVREDGPVQQPNLKRLRDLLDCSQARVMLVSGPDKVVGRLGGRMPVAIPAQDWETPAEEIDDIFLGDAEIWRRPSEGTANPHGGLRPYVSPDGDTIIDIRFEGCLQLEGRKDVGYDQVARVVEAVPGVVGHGLIVGGVSAVLIASHAGPHLLYSVD